MAGSTADRQRISGRARRRRAADTGRPRGLDAAEVRALVGQARCGNRQAFGLLYLEYRAKVFHVVRCTLDPAAAEDAVAETFVRAWTALPRYRDTGAPFVAWLYGIARHVVADVHRDRARVQPEAEPPQGATTVSDRPEERLVLGAALARLPAEQRAVIELKYLADLSNEQVGIALGKSPGAVNAQQWRALASLRSMLEAS